MRGQVDLGRTDELERARAGRLLVTITSESLLWSSSSSFLAAGTSELERARAPTLGWREPARVDGFLTLPILASSASHGFARAWVVEVVVTFGLASEGLGAAAAAAEEDPREKRLAQRSGAGRGCVSSASDELSGLIDRRFEGRASSGAFVSGMVIDIASDEEAEAARFALTVGICRRGFGTVLLARTDLSGCSGSRSDESELGGDPDLRKSSSAETKLEDEVVEVAATGTGDALEERFVPSRGEIPLRPMLAHSIGGGDAARFRLPLSAKNRDSIRFACSPSDPGSDSEAEESTMTVSLTRGFVVARIEVG